MTRHKMRYVQIPLRHEVYHLYLLSAALLEEFSISYRAMLKIQHALLNAKSIS